MTASASQAYEGQAAPHDRMVAAVTAVLLLIGMPIAYLSGNTSTGDVIGLCAMLIVSFGVMAAGFLWLLSRQRAGEHSARTALVLSLVALLTGIVFWTGVPAALAASAVALGLTARAGASNKRATAAVVIGAIVIVASFVLLLVG